VDVKAASMAALSHDVRNFVDRPVIDKTGIAGVFHIHLEFTPDENTAGFGAGAPADPSGLPSIFTALQEQFGLKLEPGAKGLDESIVIDRVERPSEN
jgi:uncharacterized protein (TIGR03435 family)